MCILSEEGNGRAVSGDVATFTFTSWASLCARKELNEREEGL